MKWTTGNTVAPGVCLSIPVQGRANSYDARQLRKQRLRRALLCQLRPGWFLHVDWCEVHIHQVQLICFKGTVVPRFLSCAFFKKLIDLRLYYHLIHYLTDANNLKSNFHEWLQLKQKLNNKKRLGWWCSPEVARCAVVGQF